MIPQYFIQLDSFTYLPNGKIDKNSLPLPELKTGQNIIKPRNEIDKKLLKIFQEIFKISNIGIEESFFELGGDSLIAIKLSCDIQDKFNVQITVQDLFAMPTIRELSDYISTKTEEVDDIIKKVELNEYYPASSAQKRIYIASKLDENSLAYNMPGKIYLNGKLDVKKLENSLNTLIKEHEILRTAFSVLENAEIVQKIIPNYEIKINTQICNVQNTEQYIKQFIRPFNLEEAPLFRIELLKINEEQYELLFDMHHIISDGTSIQIFVKQLEGLYNSQKIERLDISYKDYSNWEHDRLESGKLEKQESYWLSQFATDEIPVLNLPLDYKRPLKQAFSGDKVYETIDGELYNNIQELCDKYSITPYMLFLSAYYILLSRYSGQEEIVIGTPIVNRNRKEFQNILGVFINEMPIKIKADSDTTFANFIKYIKEIAINSLNNRRISIQ